MLVNMSFAKLRKISTRLTGISVFALLSRLIALLSGMFMFASKILYSSPTPVPVITP